MNKERKDKVTTNNVVELVTTENSVVMENNTVNSGENENMDIYSICSKIMDNSSIITFYPTKKENDKNGKTIKKNIAENIVHNDSTRVIRKVFTDYSSIDVVKINQSVKHMEIVEFLKREYKKNQTNFSISVERLSTLRISLSDGKFIFGKNENYSLKEIAESIAFFVLNHNCKNGKMLQIHTICNNGEKKRVINTVNFVPGFYTKKESKAKKEISNMEKILNAANSSDISKNELLAIIEKLTTLYNENNSIDKLNMSIEEFGKGKKVN